MRHQDNLWKTTYKIIFSRDLATSITPRVGRQQDPQHTTRSPTLSNKFHKKYLGSCGCCGISIEFMVLVSKFQYWYRLSNIGIGLPILVSVLQYWYRFFNIGIGFAILVSVLQYWYWFCSIGIGFAILVSDYPYQYQYWSKSNV